MSSETRRSNDCRPLDAREASGFVVDVGRRSRGIALKNSSRCTLDRELDNERTYEHAIREFVAWYCSEPRLAFNRTVVLRYRIHLEQRRYAPATINLRLAAVRRIAYEAADAGLLSPELAADQAIVTSRRSDR